MASAIRIMASALLLAWAVTATAQPAAGDRPCLEGIERVPPGPSSWSSWEDGMSNRARDVTH